METLLDTVDDRYEFKDFIRIIWEQKFIILSTVLIILAVSGVWFIAKYPKRVSATSIIKLDFDGIEKHLNPDGTQFSKYDIIKPQIIAQATEAFESKNSISIKNMFSDGSLSIDIEEVIPDEIQKRIKQSDNNGQIYNYFPNVFKLVLKAKENHTIQENDLKAVLTETINAYTKEFERVYINSGSISVDLPEGFIDNYEFVDIIHVLRKNAEQLQEYLDAKIQDSVLFKSPRTGMDFGDIKKKTDILVDIYIVRAEAIIRNSQLIRNKSAVINVYQNKINNLSLLQKKKAKEVEVAYNLLNDLKQIHNSTGTASTTNRKTKTPSGLIYNASAIDNLKKNDYLSYLIKSILDAETQSINYAVEIEFLEKEIKAILEKKDNSFQAEEVQQNLMLIADKISEYTQQVNVLNSEYLEKRIKGSIKIVRHPSSSVSRKKNVTYHMGLTFAVSLVFAFFTVFFIDYFRTNQPAT